MKNTKRFNYCDYCGKILSDADFGSVHLHCLDMETESYEDAEPGFFYKTIHQMILDDEYDEDEEEYLRG